MRADVDRRATLLVVLLALCIGGGCQSHATSERDGRVVVDHAVVDLADDAASNCFAAVEGRAAGALRFAALDEASGIVASAKNPGVFWAHNDAGNAAELFAFNRSGELLARYALAGVVGIDIEDLALGPSEDGLAEDLFIADIGDNDLLRGTVVVYRFAEPIVKSDQAPITASLAPLAEYVLRYPDGAHDAETLIVDPVRGDLLIATKTKQAPAKLFVSTAPLDPLNARLLVLAGSLAIGQPPLEASDRRLTAGDARDNQIILRTYSGAFLWRSDGVPLAEALTTTRPCALPVDDAPQGEAIALDPAGAGYFTISEALRATLYHYQWRE
ncbi:MAG: hypothetical protein H6707_02490 [Deltaproteobacteria bacterium]|nr:hypothetical protein [Deltaproteobacteria bacterium]